MNVLVTGSSGLIGSEAVEYFDRQGHAVFGIDNNMRRLFFGPKGDTTWNLERLKAVTRLFTHLHLDIRDREAIFQLFKEHRFDLIVHCAAQPSHDKAKEIPLIDFDVNALGTINLLEATRQYSPDAAFVFMSTNKVYGDAPNEKPLVELPLVTTTLDQKITMGLMKLVASTKPCTPSLVLLKRLPTSWHRSTDAIGG